MFQFSQNILACLDFLDPPKKNFDFVWLIFAMFRISRTKLDMFQILRPFRLSRPLF